jgi:hypothetical protein
MEFCGPFSGHNDVGTGANNFQGTFLQISGTYQARGQGQWNGIRIFTPSYSSRNTTSTSMERYSILFVAAQRGVITVASLQNVPLGCLGLEFSQ